MNKVQEALLNALGLKLEEPFIFGRGWKLRFHFYYNNYINLQYYDENKNDWTELDIEDDFLIYIIISEPERIKKVGNDDNDR